MAKRTKSEFSASIHYIIIGALLVAFKDDMLGIAMTVAGIFFILSGALDVLRFNAVGGAVSLIIGIAILVLGWVMAAIVLLVLGILIALKGFIALIDVLRKKRRNTLEILFPILSIVLGIMLAFGNGIEAVLLIVGVLFIVDGALGLIGAVKK